MRSVRITAAAGIVAAGLALGAAGIASAATPNTAPAPAPAKTVAAQQAKTMPARVHAKPAHTVRVANANYVVTASHLNVRTGPGTKYRVVGTLARGAHVIAGTKTVNGFRQLSDGHWVSAHYLKAAR